MFLMKIMMFIQLNPILLSGQYSVLCIEVCLQSQVEICVPWIRLTKPVGIPGSVTGEEPGNKWLDILHISDITQPVSRLRGVTHSVVKFLCSLNVEMWRHIETYWDLEIIELLQSCHMFEDRDVKTAAVLRSSQVFQESCGQESVGCEVSSPLILHCQDILNTTRIFPS